MVPMIPKNETTQDVGDLDIFVRHESFQDGK